MEIKHGNIAQAFLLERGLDDRILSKYSDIELRVYASDVLIDFLVKFVDAIELNGELSKNNICYVKSRLNAYLNNI